MSSGEILHNSIAYTSSVQETATHIIRKNCSCMTASGIEIAQVPTPQLCSLYSQSNRNRPNFTRFICSGSGRVFQYGCHEAGLRVGV